MDNLQAVATIPLNQPQVPLISRDRVENVGREAYIWKLGKVIYISKKNMVIAEEFLRSRSWEACVRKLREEMGIRTTVATVKKRLELPEVREWVLEQMDERGIYAGWTREHFLAVLTDHMSGKKRLHNGDLYAMKILMEAKGFRDVGVMNQSNVQINFTQSDGRA